MGSPENDTIIILPLNVMIENERDKKREIAKRTCPFRSPSLSLSLSFHYTTHYIRARARARLCRRSHAVRSATNRILRRWRRSKTKPNKARREEERTKGPFLSRRLRVRGACTRGRESAYGLSPYSLSLLLGAYACSLPLVHYETRDRVSLAAETFSRLLFCRADDP